MMKKKQIFYDKKIDALWIRMRSGTEVDSEEIAPGMTVEYNEKGEVIGVEILRATRLFDSAGKRAQSLEKYTLFTQ